MKRDSKLACGCVEGWRRWRGRTCAMFRLTIVRRRCFSHQMQSPRVAVAIAPIIGDHIRRMVSRPSLFARLLPPGGA